MRIVLGQKTKDISSEEFKKLANSFSFLEIDLGTGDGRYIYKSALKKEDTLFIGVDPVEKQLKKYSREAIRKKLKNTLFVLGAAENLPKELESFANTVSVLLPWGSLLDYVANCNELILKKIKALLKKEGNLKILFGYTNEAEPTETDRLNLELLTEKYLSSVLVPKYLDLGFKLVELKELSKEELREYETSWSKKLSFGKERPIFLLNFQPVL